MTTRFEDLGLDELLLSNLGALGFETPTPIQERAIPHMLEGRDVLGKAGTGTGKTAAFGLPILTNVVRGGGVQALILAPTRELAMQVGRAMDRLRGTKPLNVLTVYGGSHFGPQLQALRRGVEVVVGTPGRTLDHIERGTLNLDNLKIFVLDEADEMLDMGFQDELEAILAAAPKERQTALFSATFPPRLGQVIASALKDPVRVEVGIEEREGEITEKVYAVDRRWKAAALARVLEVEEPESALVFGRTRAQVEELAEGLHARGHDADALHGGLSQAQRERVLGRLRGGRVRVLVATDVAARGLDVPHLSLVVSVGVPDDPSQYVHRIGRTGRAGRDGKAVLLVEPREKRRFRDLCRLIKRDLQVEDVPGTEVLRTRQLDRIRKEVAGVVEEDGHASYKAMVESYPGGAEELAAAVLAVLHAQLSPGEEAEIPSVMRRDGPPQDRQPVRQRAGQAGWTRLFVGVGRDHGVRAGDLYGAIAGETGVRELGRIQVRGRFSVVEVPSDAADHVIESLRHASIRGRPVHARRDNQG
jgi:ATP-dependent RNA helicase DeaD